MRSLSLIFILFAAFSSYAEIIKFDSLIKNDFSRLEGENFTQRDIEDHFDFYREGVARIQIIDGKIYTLDKKMWAASQRVEHRILALYLDLIQETLDRHKINNVDFLLSFHDSGEHLRFNDQLNNRFVPIFVAAKNKSNLDYPVKLLFVDYFYSRWQQWFNLIMKANNNSDYEWNNKKDVAFWRGATNGRGYAVNSFRSKPRIITHQLSKEYPKLLDAGLIRFHDVPKKVLDLMQKEIGLVSPVNLVDHLYYKYQITIDGQTATYPGFLWRLLSNSLTIKQDSENVQWFYPLLKENIHYLSVKNDLSDLLEKIEYAKSHDQEMKEIATRATELVKDNINKERIYEYVAMALNEYGKHQDFALEKPGTWFLDMHSSRFTIALRDYFYGIYKAVFTKPYTKKVWRHKKYK